MLGAEITPGKWFQKDLTTLLWALDLSSQTVAQNAKGLQDLPISITGTYQLVCQRKFSRETCDVQI